MTTETAAELRRNLERIQAHNSRHIRGLQGRIADRERVGLPHHDLDRQLQQAETVGARKERLASQQLKAAEKRAAVQGKVETARLTKVTADIDLRRRHLAERAWVASGGNPDEFVRIWPTVRDAMLSQSVILDTLRQDLRRRRIPPTL